MFTARLRFSLADQQARRRPAAPFSASAARDQPLDLAAVIPPLQHRLARALGKHRPTSLSLLALVWTGRSPWRPPNSRRRRASPHRAATVTARTASYPAAPHKWPQWFTRVALILLNQTSGRTELCNASLPNPSELAAAELRLRHVPPLPAPATQHSRPIRNQRPRLDPAYPFVLSHRIVI